MRPQLEKIIGRLSLMQKLKEVDVFYTQKKDDAFLRAKILQPRDYDFVVAVGAMALSMKSSVGSLPVAAISHWRSLPEELSMILPITYTFRKRRKPFVG